MENNEVPRTETELARAKAVDAVCDEFEAAWNAKQRPLIETFLAVQPAVIRMACFRELLITELALRAPGDPEAALEKYLARFPLFSKVITEVFASWPPERASGIHRRFGSGHEGVIQKVQGVLRGSSSAADPFATAPETTPLDPQRHARELWGLLLRLVPADAPGEDETERVAKLASLARRLLKAFPAPRNEMLNCLLLGDSLEDVANRFNVTQHTVRATHELGVKLLSKR